MNAKTLHSGYEWDQILRLEKNSHLIADDALKPGLSVQQFIEGYSSFSPFANQAKGQTRQSKLFNIIRSDAPHNIVRTAYYLYRGFRRGFRTFVDLVERENGRLLKVAPPDSARAQYFWEEMGTSHLNELIELFGWMQSEKSHEYLLSICKPPYHPLIQAEAINAMAFEGDKFDSAFMINLVRNPMTPEPQLYHGIYCMMYHSDKYDLREYGSALWPLLMHPSRIIFQETVRTLAPRRFCRRKLVAFHHVHRAAESLPQEFLAYLETELNSHHEDDLY